MTIKITEAVKQDYRRILSYLKEHPHTTVKDIALDVFRDASAKTCLKVSRRLDDLLHQQLIGRYTSNVYVGYRSPYIYHLTNTGAKMLGMDGIASQHRHKPSAKHVQHLHTKRELERWAATEGLLLATQQLACKGYLFKYITYIHALLHSESQADEEVKEQANGYPAWSLLPHKMLTDYVLVTAYDCIIVVVTHPGAHGRIVRSRIEKYAALLRYVKLLVVTQTDNEYQNCCYALEDEQYQAVKDKVLIVQVGDLPALPRTIQESATRYMDDAQSQVATNWRVKHGTLPETPFSP